MTGVFSAANERAVELFLDKRIGYFDIFDLVERTCDRHQADNVQRPSLDDIVAMDEWARRYVDELLGVSVASTVR